MKGEILDMCNHFLIIPEKVFHDPIDIPTPGYFAELDLNSSLLILWANLA
jgi:hypothetical protein